MFGKYVRFRRTRTSKNMRNNINTGITVAERKKNR